MGKCMPVHMHNILIICPFTLKLVLCKINPHTAFHPLFLLFSGLQPALQASGGRPRVVFTVFDTFISELVNANALAQARGVVQALMQVDTRFGLLYIATPGAQLQFNQLVTPFVTPYIQQHDQTANTFGIGNLDVTSSQIIFDLTAQTTTTPPVRGIPL